jgi:hypothetical protein
VGATKSVNKAAAQTPAFVSNNANQITKQGSIVPAMTINWQKTKFKKNLKRTCGGRQDLPSTQHQFEHANCRGISKQ